MKILMVNKFFYIKGGSETYYFSLKRLLEEKGHEVIDFSMKDQRNFPSPYEEYFVESVDYNADMTWNGRLKAAANIIYSVEAKKKLERLIKKTRPDIAHLHIFQHQLSPSILDVLKKHRIPVVYTAHDLKMLCLNYVMMTHGELCEKCRGGRYINCLRQRCVKDSLAKSGINVIEGYLHKWRKTYNIVDVILTPSNFYRKKFLEFGIEGKRVVHLPNLLDRPVPEVIPRPDRNRYFLYFGRLSREKGIMTLIKAIEPLNSRLYIVGTGPAREEIEAYLSQNRIDNVELMGYQSGQTLIDLVGNAKAVVIPSEWYENGPYSAIEALQLGRPLIGSELGGIPELIDGNGMTFHHKQVEELRKFLSDFPAETSEEYQAMVNKSKAIFEAGYRANQHYDRLEAIYSMLLREKEYEYNSQNHTLLLAWQRRKAGICGHLYQGVEINAAGISADGVE